MIANARRAQRGLALVSVLWGVAILSVIAAAMLTGSLTTAYVGRNVWNATRGATLDEAAINRGILSLMDARPGGRPRTDGGARTLRFDGAAVRVWIQDEAGRININAADQGTLQSLFVFAGLEKSAAGALADRIVAKRQPAGAAAMPASSTPVTFHTIDELLRVPGVSKSLYGRILPLITVYGRGTSVDTNVAPRAVLLALPNATPSSVDDILRDREAKRAAGQAAGAAPSPGGAFTITAESRVGTARAIRVAVVQFTGDETKPYWFLSWQ